MTPEEEKKLQIEKDNQETLVEAAEWLGEELKKAGADQICRDVKALRKLLTGE